MKTRAGVVLILQCAAWVLVAAGRCAYAGESLSSGEQLRLLKVIQEGAAHDNSEIVALAESTDGRFVAWADEAGGVTVYSFEEAGGVTVYSFEEEKTLAVVTPPSDNLGLISYVIGLGFDDRGRLWWWQSKPDGTAVSRVQVGLGEHSGARVVYSTQEVPVHYSVNVSPWGIVLAKPRFKSLLSFAAPWYLSALELSTGRVHVSEPLIPEGAGGSNEIITDVVRSPDGRYLVALTDEDAALLSLPDMKILKRFGVEYCRLAAFSPSSSLVAIGTGKNGILVWETATGKLVKEMPLRGGPLAPGFDSWDDSMIFAGEKVLYPAVGPLYRVDLTAGTAIVCSDLNATVVLVSRSSERLYVGTNEGGVYVLELPASDRVRRTGSAPGGA